MRMNKQIVVTDWIKEKPKLGLFLKLTLSSDERRILRGKRLTDCDQEIILQLPRKGKLNDGDILSTNKSNFYIEIIAKTEDLFEISIPPKQTVPSNPKVEPIEDVLESLYCDYAGKK